MQDALDPLRGDLVSRLMCFDDFGRFLGGLFGGDPGIAAMCGREIFDIGSFRFDGGDRPAKGGNQTTDREYAGWFNTGAGMPQLKNVFRRLSAFGLDEEKAMLSANFGENGAAWYMVDCFYFPGRLLLGFFNFRKSYFQTLSLKH